MNRSVCRAMVTVAGLAVPGVTATLAGAQTRPAAFPLNDVMAFVSHRSSHSLIGVYDFVRQTIVRLSPSLDYDSSWP